MAGSGVHDHRPVPLVPPDATHRDDGPRDDPRHLARWVLLGCALVGLAATLCLVYVSVLSGVLIFVSGPIGLVLALAWMSPATPDATAEEQYAALEEAWAMEVPASQEAMVRAYLEDPESAVDAVVGRRGRISREVARTFLADKVTG